VPTHPVPNDGERTIAGPRVQPTQFSGVCPNSTRIRLVSAKNSLTRCITCVKRSGIGCKGRFGEQVFVALTFRCILRRSCSLKGSTTSRQTRISHACLLIDEGHERALSAKECRKTHEMRILPSGCGTRTARSFLSAGRQIWTNQKFNVNKWDCHTQEPRTTLWFVGVPRGALSLKIQVFCWPVNRCVLHFY
jgi:hypothetical protein